MNHIYRIVKNKKTGLWVVACEIARSHSGGAASALVVGALGLAGMAQLAMAADPSAIPITGSKATVAIAPNNTATTVVNIQAPTAAGLSHNQYSKFNVTKGGLILNNADGLNNLTVETKLAGQILANQNLTHSALVILNEVMTNNASILNGFIEVAGTKADVLVANYNGITCATCGFINAGRATLTTGLPVVSNGALTGLNVTQGTITIKGSGMNAGGADLLDLLARSATQDDPQAWCAAWQSLDAGPLAQALARQARSPEEPLCISLCGTAQGRSYTLGAPRAWQRLAQLWPARRVATYLEDL